MRNDNERKHWIFKKHTNNINLLIEIALYLKSNKAGISIEEKEKMYELFRGTDIYNPRNSLRDVPLDSINHKLDGLSYYMFGYSDTINGKKKFIFSPLGNLFLNHLDQADSLAKIFATMLFSMQFAHPASKPSEEFSIYPFRLIFALLLDPRLKGVLFNYEVYRYLIYQDRMTPEIYEELVSRVIDSRMETDIEKFKYLKDKEFQIVKSTYEWQYYVSSLLQAVGIIIKNDGDRIVELYHPQKTTSRSKPTKRKINNGFFKLSETVIPLIKNLFKKYSLYDTPLALGDSNRKSDDIVKEIYSFYPNELLDAIDEVPDQSQIQLLELPKLIEEYSKNPDNKTANKFEEVLEDAFNLFVNVDAKRLAGAGRTDIECLYLTISEKFAVEAKSTANKLNGINAGRLRRHRNLIGAKYTIVVTPRYVPSVKYDIAGQEVVIIKANTLSEYLYNNIISNNRDIDYAEIQNIIVNNLGKDISTEISELTLCKFG